MRRRVNFHECEHKGDLDQYEEDLINSGANILLKEINHDAETGEIIIEVPDSKYMDFFKKFKKTDSFGFSSLND